jgi:hypothetical protein
MPKTGHRERTGISLTKTGITIYSLTERGSSVPALQAYSKFQESSLLYKVLVQPFEPESMRTGQTEGSMSRRLTFTLQAPILWGEHTMYSRFSQISLSLWRQAFYPKSSKCKADCKKNSNQA